MRILSGVQPSGNLHIGNYFGMMRPCLELQDKGESYLFVADYHALTQLPDAAQLQQRITNVSLDFFKDLINLCRVLTRRSRRVMPDSSCLIG